MPVIEHFPFTILNAPSIRLETEITKKSRPKIIHNFCYIINMHRKACLIDQSLCTLLLTGLVNSVPNLPNRQVTLFGEFKLKKLQCTVINPAH